jgi:uncharacterized protein with PIN domain
LIDAVINAAGGESMANCPHCDGAIRPVRDESAAPAESGGGISGGTWICPECETILSVSEIDLS